ncbi:MAG: hypothetical protein LLG06_10090 [Desulfobacteraceae bacterium]|nr:hypothetical protein [Desulfobacteraceae bacterium]
MKKLSAMITIGVLSMAVGLAPAMAQQAKDENPAKASATVQPKPSTDVKDAKTLPAKPAAEAKSGAAALPKTATEAKAPAAPQAKPAIDAKSGKAQPAPVNAGEKSSTVKQDEKGKVSMEKAHHAKKQTTNKNDKAGAAAGNPEKKGDANSANPSSVK